MSTITSWVPVAPNTDFTIHNLPYGIFSTYNRSSRPGVAIGDQILDLQLLADFGYLGGLEIPTEVFQQDTLNDFIALGKPIWSALRKRIQDLLTDGNDTLLEQASELLVAQSSATMHMPVAVGDYTDFYSSIEHATNVGSMFRDPAKALLPNWKHLPVGYHGRASSIVVSGTPIHRPKGQRMPKDADQPVFGPSTRLDIELEMAFIVGKNTELGQSISTAEASEAIFGMVLFNDWSARDIQKWEYVPLGPFLGKSFASSISPWIVTMEALEPFRVAGPAQDPAVLSYLNYEGDHNYDIQLEVSLQLPNKDETTICRSNYRYMYWNMAQQLAHHTVNGCNVRVGDMMASGTISGKEKDSYGSLLELTWAGRDPLQLEGGAHRTFLEDHDTVIMRGHAEKDGIRVGFGEVKGQILPAV